MLHTHSSPHTLTIRKQTHVLYIGDGMRSVPIRALKSSNLKERDQNEHDSYV